MRDVPTHAPPLGPPCPSSSHPPPSPSHFQTPMHLSSRPTTTAARQQADAGASRRSNSSVHLVDLEQPQRVERGEHDELEEGVVAPRKYWLERRRSGWARRDEGRGFKLSGSILGIASRFPRPLACAVMRLSTGRFGRLVWCPLGIAARFDDAGGGVFRVSAFGCGRCYEARPGWCPGMCVSGARVWACHVDDVPAFVRHPRVDGPRARPSHTPRAHAASRDSATRLRRRLACTSKAAGKHVGTGFGPSAAAVARVRIRGSIFPHNTPFSPPTSLSTPTPPACPYSPAPPPPPLPFATAVVAMTTLVDVFPTCGLGISVVTEGPSIKQKSSPCRTLPACATPPDTLPSRTRTRTSST
ncbi:hypothetical protein B0H14DRAFT_3158906 [Mycena olivaceomarginata]|nr:hypothetical protein B0H14DRAFT_3158906 [Mycena olivaceomarginata]